MSDTMVDFDVTGPLPTGTTLIEASAGTGKTWTLSALVVRYVAEGGHALGELLIVTFSRAASQELRERVRARLAQSLAVLQHEDATDDVLTAHLRDCPPDELALRIDRLASAVADFDTATIATIHQFCHHVLASLGIAGDSDPHATLAEDLTGLRDDVVDDLYLADHATSGSGVGDYSRAAKDARIALDNPTAALSPAHPTGRLRERLRFVARVRDEVGRRKRRAALLGYDDLLSELARALEDDDGPARRRMRERWSVVLVDEFQDTDPVQWQVFSRAFDTGEKTLVLIGDPKQAIYGFRGGDVNTYLSAAATSGTRASLPTNFRSDAPLVDALQMLMMNVELSPGIVALPVSAHRTGRRLAGAPDGAAVRVRAMPGNPVPIGVARQAIATDAADDITRLLASDATFDGDSIAPQHLAVLAHTNRDLRAMREALRTRDIPSVLVSSESVLRTTAAEWWLELLMALEQPHRPERVRLAALTPFLGWSAEQLGDRGDAGTEAVAVRIRALIGAFRRGGIAAVLDVSRGQGLGARLLARVGGERDLTDLEHCAQLLQEQVLDGVGVAGLVAWLKQQSADDATATADARIMRLDSDALAVTLSTIHGSKGLQYPIVYAPFLFDNWMAKDPTPAIIHRDGQRVLSFDSDEVGLPEHRSEALGENMRLAYVAMTRAQSQLVMWWAPTPRNTTNSALHRLLFGQAGSADALASLLSGRRDRRVPDRPLSLPGSVRLAGETASEAILRTWSEQGAFSLAEIGDGGPARQVASNPPTASLTVREFDDSWVDRAWRRTSYSALTTVAETAASPSSEPEPDAVGRVDEEPITVVGEGSPAGADRPSPMAGLPVGATFGSLVHAVLEEADFRASDLRSELVDRIRDQLIWWPVDLDVDTLATALEAVCTTPMGPSACDATLVDLPRADRFAEMEFELPLAGGDRPHRSARLRSFAGVLRAHLPQDDPLRPYADALDGDELGGQRLQGYLTGSVDLTFRHGGKFYVVDYKTNWLGAPGADLTLADYAPARLAAAMNHSSYPLQALLYSVVLHRYLRWRLPGYAPETHLGGVMYLYLRGMAGPSTPTEDGLPCGVFSWRPPAAMLTELSSVLDGRGRAERGMS